MAVRFCCDWCDKQLPIKVEGSEGKNKKITAELTYPREINIQEYFPHLCQSCARKIDIVVGLSQERGYRKADILERYARVNEERRERLGTKG